MSEQIHLGLLFLYKKLEWIVCLLGVLIQATHPINDYYKSLICGAITGAASFATVKFIKYGYKKLLQLYYFIKEWAHEE